MKKLLGHIVGGSLADGFAMRIHYTADLEDIKTGKFVSICGKHYTFFSLITDLSLAVSNPDILINRFPIAETAVSLVYASKLVLLIFASSTYFVVFLFRIYLKRSILERV